jgi:hypothetical protein
MTEFEVSHSVVAFGVMHDHRFSLYAYRMSGAVFLAVFLAVFIRPWLWPTALGAMFALAPRRWWTRTPFLPIPDADVIGWRKTTAYGSSSTPLVPDDVVSYLEWRRSQPV